jgi:hypothetical protein
MVIHANNALQGAGVSVVAATMFTSGGLTYDEQNAACAPYGQRWSPV